MSAPGPRAYSTDVRAVVAQLVGDDGVARQLLQRGRRGALQQRVARRHDDAVRPAVARQRDQRVVARQRLRATPMSARPRAAFGHLAGRALVQVQAHFGKQPRKSRTTCGSAARLRVRGGNRQRLPRRHGNVARALEVVGQAQALDDKQQPARRHARQALARAGTKMSTPSSSSRIWRPPRRAAVCSMAATPGQVEAPAGSFAHLSAVAESSWRCKSPAHRGHF